MYCYSVKSHWSRTVQTELTNIICYITSLIVINHDDTSYPLFVALFCISDSRHQFATNLNAKTNTMQIHLFWPNKKSRFVLIVKTNFNMINILFNKMGRHEGELLITKFPFFTVNSHFKEKNAQITCVISCLHNVVCMTGWAAVYLLQQESWR